MIERLDAIEKKYQEIQESLTNPEVYSDMNKMKELSKEAADLEDTVVAYRKYKKVLSGIEDTKEMVKDPEMAEIAREELENLEVEKTTLEQELEKLLIPKDPNDDKNIICEIRAGAGGEEAALFAGTLFRMYCMYAERKHFKIEILNENETGLGGYKEITFMVKGKGAYSRLKFESGVHRVQRVPDTESSGRIHTSTATVAVLPEVEDVEIEINPADIKMEVFRASRCRRATY